MLKYRLYTLLVLTLLSIPLLTSTLPTNLARAQDQTTMFVHPASIVDPTLMPSNNFTVFINVSDVTDLFTWQAKLLFDPSIIECTNAYYPPGHVFDGLTNIPVVPQIDNVTGFVLHGCTLLLESVDVPQGVLCAFDFHVLDMGSSALTLDQADSFLLDGDLIDIPIMLEDGYFENQEVVELHDVAVTDVSPSPTSVTVGDSVTIDVTVENQGDFTETFDVTAYYDGNTIDTLTDVSLNVGESDILSFTWDTTGVPLGSYTISANVTVVEGEEETADNSLVDDTVEVVEAPPPHDIAVTDVSPSQTVVAVGEPIDIDVTVENQGTEAETFDVTVYSDQTIIDIMTDVSLNAGVSDVLSFAWDTAEVAVGNYTISANASAVAGEEDVADNCFEDGTVEVVEAPPPPPPPAEGPIIVDWADYPTRDYPCGDPRYPFGGRYHNGQYPVWKNFTVTNNDTEGNIVYIAVQYPEATPTFKPSRYMIEVVFPYDPGWTINVNLADRLIEFFADGEGIPPGGCAILSVQFKDGPIEEDCSKGHVFHVTATLSKGKSAYSQTFQHTVEYIDKTPPNVGITFPDKTTPGGEGYAFVKKEDGYIWVLTPDCQVKNIGWLWINGTASDGCSGVNRVEIWINGTYMGDATLSEPAEPGKARDVTWWWYTDPTNHPDFWKDESWYYVVARAYDNSANNAETVMHGDQRVSKTNRKDTVRHWFFWIGAEIKIHVMLDHEHIEWTPGNGRIDVWGETGFYPNGEVEIWLENELYRVKKHLKNVTADNYGRFYTTIHHLPEVPRKPECGDHWIIRAIDKKCGNSASDRLAIIPWITFEDTNGQDDPTTWQTTEKGHVDDTIDVYGHGFLPSRQPEWDPYCTVYVRIYYTGVAPVVIDQISQRRRVFNGTSQLKWDNLEWSPRLSEILLAEVVTDENGYWSAQIKIPQSYGGLHAIYACEYKIVADSGRTCPNTNLELVCSGWPECIEIEKEAQSVIFDVWPTLEISPSTTITGQYVTITGEGLPLPRYYRLWKNGEAIVESRDWCFVLDFGSNEHWVFENKRIRNNELDIAWVEERWYPFSFYTPDPIEFLDSPVWKGKLTSITKDYTEECKESYQFHIGSKYLKVPVLPPDDYLVTIYYYDKNAESFTHDHYASVEVMVIKDPLNIDVKVGGLHLPGEDVDATVQVDVDGSITDATSLALELCRGDTLIANLSYERIDTGFYIASFMCPNEAGDYFIKVSATKDYELFTLYGIDITAFTVNPTLAQMNATIIRVEGHMATIDTGLETIKADLTEINAEVVDIQGRVITINTTMGALRADIQAINTEVVEVKGDMLTLKTDLGTLKEKAEDLKAKITSVQDETVKIHTIVGDLNASLDDINGIVHIEEDLAKIETDLGDLRGKVVELKDVDIATIETAIGRVTAKADSIKSDVGLQPVTIGLSLIAALAAIAAAALILRKVYLK